MIGSIVPMLPAAAARPRHPPRETGAAAPRRAAADPAPHERVSAVAVELFRFNGRLLAAGDRVVAPLRLTSARWQVLGAVALAPHPGPVAHVARDMGLARQSVRRIVGDLVAEDMLELAPNPHHRRAPLVLLTGAGRAAYARAMELWAPRAAAAAEGIPDVALDATLETLRQLRLNLEAATEGDDEGGD